MSYLTWYWWAREEGSWTGPIKNTMCTYPLPQKLYFSLAERLLYHWLLKFRVQCKRKMQVPCLHMINNFKVVTAEH